jgi:hypothetical protein
MTYCPVCRGAARFPWEHDGDCKEGLRHQIRWYQATIPWVLLILFAQTVLLIIGFILLGKLT